MSLRPAYWNDPSYGGAERHALYTSERQNPMAISRLIHHYSNSGREVSPPADWNYVQRHRNDQTLDYARPPSSCSSAESMLAQRQSQKSRSSTMYFRWCREQNMNPPIARIVNGRFFCAYRSPHSGRTCTAWSAGYSTLHELGRHVDSDHAPEEAQLIEEGRLTFATSQWIKTPEQHMIVKENVFSTNTCEACGTRFASNRPDSIGRHLKNGACQRAQERQTKLALAPTQHKKKNNSSYAGQIRR
ncbi:hypothetical protein M422DRAFT_238597 [Sphaerobolus stellatus SS14]|nr:hypothetical protein M422DRAFT_238597 [Sphaerobolus stellatus SS14]